MYECVVVYKTYGVHGEECGKSSLHPSPDHKELTQFSLLLNLQKLDHALLQ